ncbi:alpha-galactosidase [Ahrensia sp. 13_GOM-1096m]|uniref:alpha-galactosidase n=1 Tax=Ahrensia sp. 13_GOM-1096m TaxID=1380380 RepID=UPI000686EE38|nr:alpha-galactosidase [Ahrensia sp. 13_GOM-1096m]
MSNYENTLRLDGWSTTLVFAWNDGIPVVIYHGEKLQSGIDLGVLADIHARPFTQASLDDNSPISLHPELGRGFLGHPGLIGHRVKSDKPGWAGQFVFARRIDREHGVTFGMIDAVRGMEMEIVCDLDPETDVAVFATELFNVGDSPVSVDWLSAPVVVPAQQYSQHLSFHGRWCAEFQIERQPIPMGLTKRENRRGRTSHEAFPGLILLNAKTDDESGPCLGMHLGWSGNHRIVLERLSTGDVQVQMGALLFSGEGMIKPKQSMKTPSIYVAHSSNGLNALSQKFHHHVRKNILKFPVPDKPRPVTVNTWEALYFDHDHSRLCALVDAAADIGAERFVLDDGWFRGRNDDTSSLGDWYPDETKYPNGLGPLAEYVQSKGLDFGLWIEPEMINEKSELFQKHPDWVLGLNSYPNMTGRNQLVLDIANPLVSDYIFETIAPLIENHQIKYLKWDMNRDLVLPGDQSGRANVYNQTGALYALMDRFLKAFPTLEIESCASGGGRVDYGVLAHTHRFWTSDSNDSVERARIQTGFSHFFPPELMGAHIGPAWSHTSGRGLHAGFRALVASYGHMGIEADLTKMSDEDREIMRDAVTRHKQDRAIWHTGKFYRVRTVDYGLIGALSVSVALDQARMVLMQLERPRSTIPPRIRVPGLNKSAVYKVRIQTMTEQVKKANRSFPNPIFNGGFELTGAALETVGLGLPSLYAQTGLAISIEQVGEQ